MNYMNPILMNFIPYDEAITLFTTVWDQVGNNELAKVFIVLQFYIYYQNKKDVNKKEMSNFMNKLSKDTSKLVKDFVPLLKKYVKTASRNNGTQSEENSRLLQLFSQITGHNIDPIMESQLSELLSGNSYVRDDYNSNDIEAKKRLKRIKTIGEFSKLSDIVARKIIGYVLKTDSFLKQDLMEETETETWRDLLQELHSVLFSMASVSKRFHANVGYVLERIDWSGRFPNKFLQSEIQYGKPFCLFKNPPTTIRYDALVKTTSYNMINQVFSSIDSLTVVGDSIDWNWYDGTEREDPSEKYNIAEKSFITYPPIGSMPSLKSLTVVGRAYKDHKHQNATGGLFLLDYLITKVGCKLEEFTIIGYLSIEESSFQELLVKRVLELHSSTLKVIRLKYHSILSRQPIKDSIKNILEELHEHRDKIKIELYLGDEDSFELVDKFAGINYNPKTYVKGQISQDEDYDSDSDSDDY